MLAHEFLLDQRLGLGRVSRPRHRQRQDRQRQLRIVRGETLRLLADETATQALDLLAQVAHELAVLVPLLLHLPELGRRLRDLDREARQLHL